MKRQEKQEVFQVNVCRCRTGHLGHATATAEAPAAHGYGFLPPGPGATNARGNGAVRRQFSSIVPGLEIAGRRHEVAGDQLLVRTCRHTARLWRVKKEPWTIHWFHAIGTNVPFYLEKLEVKPEKPVVQLGGDVQLFSLFEDVLEGLEHGSTLRHLTYAALLLSHLMGLILAAQGRVLARRSRRPGADGQEHQIHEGTFARAPPDFNAGGGGQPVAVVLHDLVSPGDRVRPVDVFKPPAHATGGAIAQHHKFVHQSHQRSTRFFRSILLFARFQQAARCHSPSEHRRRYNA